jgi:hypothetical protein
LRSDYIRHSGNAGIEGNLQYISFLFRKLILFAPRVLHLRVVGQSAHCAVWRQGISATFSTI